MLREYDERVKDYWKTSHGNYIVTMVDNKGMEDEVKKLITMPLRSGAFVLSNSKRIMIDFIHAIIMLLLDFIEKIFLIQILTTHIES